MILCAAASLLAAGCAKQKHVGLRDDADSVAYIIGMNVGMNLLRMDSTLRADVVCEGLRDAMRGATRMTREEARDYYLRYVAFERPAKVRAYEERFLEEIRQNNRSYARTASGVTYTVESVGEERAAWERTKEELPKGWIAGYAAEELAETEAYVLPEMPTIYLLDRDKRVLLKEATPHDVLRRVESEASGR